MGTPTSIPGGKCMLSMVMPPGRTSRGRMPPTPGVRRRDSSMQARR